MNAPGPEDPADPPSIDAPLIDASLIDASLIDPDVDLRDPAQSAELQRRHSGVLPAIALGGIVGAEARYGVSLLLPHRSGEFPWSTVVVNVVGSALIGILMVVLLDLTRPHRLARPFLGVGVLGGFTTFSTFAMDTDQLLLAHRAPLALLYVVTTVALCATAVWATTVLTRRQGRVLMESRHRRRAAG